MPGHQWVKQEGGATTRELQTVTREVAFFLSSGAGTKPKEKKVKGMGERDQDEAQLPVKEITT